MPWCIYPGEWIAYKTLTSYIYMNVPLYMPCDSFICKILFGLSELSKINLGIYSEVNWVTEKSHFPGLWH